MQNLIEQLKAHSLTKYIRFDKENEQFKLYLKQPYQGLVVWKDNPNESSLMTISIHSSPKHVEKQLTHLKRMIDQELLKRFDLLNNSENVQRIRYQKENITRFLECLDELVIAQNIWKTIYAQICLLNLSKNMKDYLTDTESYFFTRISKLDFLNSTRYFKDPFFKEHPYRLNKLTLDFKKINRCREYLEDVYTDLCDIVPS
jgi:hypothetical protein